MADKNDTPALADIIPKQGERALIVGQTGSGKTKFAVWILSRMTNSPIVIYDTKGEPAFDALPRSQVVYGRRALDAAIDNADVDYIVFKIPPEVIAEPDALDSLLLHHFYNLHGCDAYVDELFSFSQNGRAGPGLVALLTQGRSKGITTIMAAQRPSWLSRFAITETQRYYVFRLVDSKDKSRLGDVIPEFADLPNPPEFGYYYYRTGTDAPVLMAPILLDKQKLPAYKNLTVEEESDTPDKGTSLNWI